MIKTIRISIAKYLLELSIYHALSCYGSHQIYPVGTFGYALAELELSLAELYRAISKSVYNFTNV